MKNKKSPHNEVVKVINPFGVIIRKDTNSEYFTEENLGIVRNKRYKLFVKCPVCNNVHIETELICPVCDWSESNEI